MKLIVKKKYVDTDIQELVLPYYYRINSNTDRILGCVTKDSHIVVKVIRDENAEPKFEIEQKKVEPVCVCIKYNTYYESLQPSSKEEFSQYLSKAVQCINSITDELQIELTPSPAA